jgi:hypothetical protein
VRPVAVMPVPSLADQQVCINVHTRSNEFKLIHFDEFALCIEFPFLDHRTCLHSQCSFRAHQSENGGLPNSVFPSDHVPLGVHFAFDEAEAAGAAVANDE